MKTAIISDIHGNPSALQTVLDDIKKQKCDRIVCLGDIVGYGYDPNKCVEMVENSCCANLMCLGNHDAAVIGKLGLDWFNPVSGAGVLRDRKKITDENRKILERHQCQYIEHGEDGAPTACFTHGCPDSELEFDYITDYVEAYCAFSTMERKKIDVCFVGHSHYADAWVKAGKSELDVEHLDYEDGIVHICVGVPTIFNVGSVGYPRNQPYSIYGIYDNEEATALWRKLPFDFKGYCANMRNHDIPIPHWMDRWVEAGFISDGDAFGE